MGANKMTYRTDRNNNPAAFTTAIAEEAGLDPTQFEQGDPFVVGDHTYYTAKLLGDPISTTIAVIDKIGFYTSQGIIRWVYIGIPYEIWRALTPTQKKDVVHFMYHKEGGTEMEPLFA